MLQKSKHHGFFKAAVRRIIKGGSLAGKRSGSEAILKTPPISTGETPLFMRVGSHRIVCPKYS